MKIIFAGTPAFAVPSLRALLQSDHTIACVLTQPDKPAGRNLQLQESAIKKLAKEHRLSLFQPATLKDKSIQALLNTLQADVMVVAAYGLLLPQAVLDIPKQGCINIHASVLPRWRGAAPIQRAIEAGDKITGITIMNMDVGLDTGDILCQQSLPIMPNDNAGTLTAKMAQLGADLIVKTIHNLEHITPKKQTEEGACYASKIDKSERKINWCDSAIKIIRKIHAFNPSPGTLTTLNGSLLKLWDANLGAEKSDGDPHPGQIVAITKDGIIIATGSGTLCITSLQMAGANRLTAQDFVKGHSFMLGQTLGT